MVNLEVHWMGLLSNVDSSILELKLPYDFKVEYITSDEAFDLFSELKKISSFVEFHRQYTWGLRCINQDENRVYYLSRTENLELDIDEHGMMSDFVVGETEQLYNDHIRQIMRLLRLCSAGDIRVPQDFRYVEYQGGLMSYITRGTSLHISSDKFHLKPKDLDTLETLKKHELPFKRQFLKLAFDMYEDSYETQNPILSFLSLMISMETLFNPAHAELRYRISRNSAILLGDTKEQSNDIFKEMKEIYDTRSKIVHSGDASEFKIDNITTLRDHIRNTIIKMLEYNESKIVILNKLNTLGFGEIAEYDSLD